MVRFWLGSVAVLLGGSIVGCGSAEVPAGGDSSTPVGKVATAEATEQSPADAIHQFLTAVRAGDDAAASQMLTTVARQKTAENQMVVAPPGSDTASFKVGEVEMIGDAGAHVASFWTDIDAEGNKHTDTIVWMVRKEGDGWRIAGMATKLAEDQPAVVLNFEEPDGMLAEQHAVETERASDSATPEKGPEAAVETAQQRENTLRDTRR